MEGAMPWRGGYGRVSAGVEEVEGAKGGEKGGWGDRRKKKGRNSKGSTGGSVADVESMFGGKKSR